MNKDFNFKFYWQHLEKFQDGGEGDDEFEPYAKDKPLLKTLKISNEYYKMMLSAPPLSEEFKANYKQWLEDEVYGYYD